MNETAERDTPPPIRMQDGWTHKAKLAWNAGYDEGMDGKALTMHEFDDDFKAKARAKGWRDGVAGREWVMSHKKRGGLR